MPKVNKNMVFYAVATLAGMFAYKQFASRYVVKALGGKK